MQADEITNRIINEALEASGLQADSLDLSSFKSPIRIGEVLDHVKNLARKSQTRFFTIGPYKLDAQHHTLEGKKEDIKLTEKETALLVLLAKNPGNTVSRKEILTKVWEYADDAETHTLETHIYRLRQKIEKDPGKPRVLMTNEDGYYLSKSL